MKKRSVLILILIVASHFGISEAFAQKKSKLREVIVVEISVRNVEEVDKREILINRTANSKYETRGAILKGCDDCSEEYETELKNSAYDFKARAWRMGKHKTKISFDIFVGEKCETKKIFMVYRNRQNKIQLDCGISLVAYYGFESEKEN